MKSAGLLVEHDGQLWLLLHRSDRRINDAMEQLISDRLTQADSTSLRTQPLLLNGSRAVAIDQALRRWGGEQRHLYFRAPLSAFSDWNSENLQFGKEVNLERAIFGNMSNFQCAKFSDRPLFRNATFGHEVSFSCAEFGQEADFSKASFGNRAAFADSIFSDRVNFSYAQFNDWALFEKAKFGEEAKFWFVNFGSQSQFVGVNFGNKAGFHKAKLGDGANFWQATFGDGVAFEGTEFLGDVAFPVAQFLGRAEFNNATMLGKIDFRAAEIKGHAGFAGCIWPERVPDHQAAFEGCRFRDVADFKTTGFKAFAMFDGAEFKGRVLLAEPGGIAEDELFAAAFEATELAALDAREETEHTALRKAAQQGLTGISDPLKSLLSDRIARRAARQKADQAADLRYGSLAGGLRTLKQAVAAQGDREREQRFFRYEVQVRARRPTEGPFAKRAAWVYGKTSNYGVSVGLPLVWAFVAGLAFATVYGTLGLATGALQWDASWDGPVQALQLSLSNSFRPFFVLETPREGVGGFWGGMLRQDDWVPLVMRGFGVLQSVATIILLFLVGVALRRKFQIG